MRYYKSMALKVLMWMTEREKINTTGCELGALKWMTGMSKCAWKIQKVANCFCQRRAPKHALDTICDELCATKAGTVLLFQRGGVML